MDLLTQKIVGKYIKMHRERISHRINEYQAKCIMRGIPDDVLHSVRSLQYVIVALLHTTPNVAHTTSGDVYDLPTLQMQNRDILYFLKK